jgi:hypothetical protein
MRFDDCLLLSRGPPGARGLSDKGHPFAEGLIRK